MPFHPLAKTPWKAAVPAPEHDAGMLALGAAVEAFGVGAALVAVDSVVGAAELLLELLPAAGTKRLLLTQDSNMGLRDEFKSCVHLPNSW